ncbi:MAG: 30S ribosomal protein S17 [Bacilli bacterium]|jgi:small subunit ribosomal protein S17
MQEKKKQEVIGKVVSDKADKTIVVLVDTYQRHSLYKKRVKASKRYLVHDENNIAKEGDLVAIEETRPLSKKKHYQVTRIVEKAVIL